MRNFSPAAFPYARGADRYGYKVPIHLKPALELILNKYPEIIFSKIYDKNSILHSTITETFTGGWGSRVIKVCATSIASYLFELGAGINLTVVLPGFDYSKIAPQLFVGATLAISENCILSLTDVVKLKLQNKLSPEDFKRLKFQATQALKYGELEPRVENELRKIRSFILYRDYKTEFSLTILQALHQLAQIGFPREITYNILGHLAGLEISEVEEVSGILIEQHEQEFPAFGNRSKFL